MCVCVISIGMHVLAGCIQICFDVISHRGATVTAAADVHECCLLFFSPPAM